MIEIEQGEERKMRPRICTYHHQQQNHLGRSPQTVVVSQPLAEERQEEKGDAERKRSVHK